MYNVIDSDQEVPFVNCRGLDEARSAKKPKKCQKDDLHHDHLYLPRAAGIHMRGSALPCLALPCLCSFSLQPWPWPWPAGYSQFCH